jgi:hypothetical protein
VDGEELAAELEGIQADLAKHADSPPDFQGYQSMMRLHMRAAWFLIAFGRYDEAIVSAEQADRARTASSRFDSVRARGGAVLWEACEAKAVVYLAREQWFQAEEATLRALWDFEEQDANYRLHELALQAQGRLHPDRIRKVSEDPARELAEFDAKRYALGHAQISALSENVVQ